MSHRSVDRRGFTLLEVMVALSILTVSLLILSETQSSSVLLTREAELVITATDLAQHTLTEALLEVEQEGFLSGTVYESGDYSDLGDASLDLEFGDDLELFEWEYAISELDVDTLGDIASMAANADRAINGEGEGDAPAGNANIGAAFSSVGLPTSFIPELIGPHLREVRVRVWWGDSLEEAEEEGTEVILTTHVINPSGAVQLEQAVPQ